MPNKKIFTKKLAIKTPRLLLKAAAEKDKKGLLRAFPDKASTKYINYYNTPKRIDSYLKKYKEFFDCDTGMLFSVFTKENKSIIGMFSFLEYDKNHKRADFGFSISKKHRNKGYAGEILKAVCRFAFNRLKLNRLQATIHPNNKASASVVLKHGFKKEGYLRKYHNFNNKPGDALIFSLLKEEWIKKR
jgi:ribosomal-protein-alanine N-acetyltransferase